MAAERRRRLVSSSASTCVCSWLLVVLLLDFSLNWLTGEALRLLQLNPDVWAFYKSVEYEVASRSLLGLFIACAVGATFLVAIPVEAAFLFYLGIGYPALTVFGIALAGILVGDLFNYVIGWLIGPQRVKAIIKEKRVAFERKIGRAGAFIIVIGKHPAALPERPLQSLHRDGALWRLPHALLHGRRPGGAVPPPLARLQVFHPLRRAVREHAEFPMVRQPHQNELWGVRRDGELYLLQDCERRGAMPQSVGGQESTLPSSPSSRTLRGSPSSSRRGITRAMPSAARTRSWRSSSSPRRRWGGYSTSALKNVGRTGLILEGFGVDHLHAKLFPMHGTKLKRWKPILSSNDKYFTRTKGLHLFAQRPLPSRRR